ncbi:MAG: ABC transporter permease [Bacteroidales bacterium]|nr:MAG: ABC transporter permease [Bacteroidales bacterium]
MILSISWKNVWRNKTRSLVVVISLVLGIFGGIMALGIMQGWLAQRVHDGIYKEVSHAQIHNPQFMLNEELQHTIINYDKVVAVLDTMKGVVAYSQRVKVFSMVQSDWAATGLVIKGIDPDKEKTVTEIYQTLVEGEYFGGNHKIPSIIIGSKAAESLKLLNYQVTKEKIDSINTDIFPQVLIEKLKRIGDKRFRKDKDFRLALKEALSPEEFEVHSESLIKYFSFYRMNTSLRITIQDKNGVIQNPVFKVRGIYKTSNSMYDGMFAFVDRKQLNQYTELNDNEIHEIAIISNDNESGAKVGDKLAEYIPENSTMSWIKLSPEIAMFNEFSAIMGYIYVGIILFALAFGIINTMMMSVLERFKELGMLMAIGMNRFKVFGMIMLESVFLSLTGGLLGMLISGIVVSVLSRTGINFGMWAEGLEAIGYSSMIYPIVTITNYISIAILVVITGMVASIWPARRALKLNPAEALRTE